MKELTLAKYSKEDVILDAFKHLPELTDCDGVIGIGSHFAPDLQASEASDIDLVVIRESRFFIKKTKSHNGCIFDFTICTLDTLRRVCYNGQSSDYWQENLRYSKTLHDGTGKVAEFMSELEEKSQFAGLVTEHKAKTFKVKVRNILRKINYNDSADFFFVREGGALPELLYFLKCYDKGIRPFIHPHRQHKHILSEFPEISEIFTIFCSNHLMSYKIAEITRLCEHCLLTTATDLPRFGVFTKMPFDFS